MRVAVNVQGRRRVSLRTLVMEVTSQDFLKIILKIFCLFLQAAIFEYIGWFSNV